MSQLGPSGYTTYTLEAQTNKYPTYTYTYVGNNTNVMNSASYYFTKGWNIKTTQGGGDPMSTLVATLNCEVQSDGITPVTGAAVYYTQNFSFHYNTTEKELLYCNSNVIPWINQITTDDKTTLQYQINNNQTGSLITSSFTGGATSISASQTVYTLEMNGMKTVPIIQPILVMNAVVPSTFNFTTLNSNLLSIYYASSVQSELGVPTNFYNIMAQPSDPAALACDNGGSIPLHYGWLKQPPTIDQNGTTVTVHQEFWFGLYPQNIYGSPH